MLPQHMEHMQASSLTGGEIGEIMCVDFALSPENRKPSSPSEWSVFTRRPSLSLVSFHYQNLPFHNPLHLSCLPLIKSKQ